MTRQSPYNRFALPRNPATFLWSNVPEEYADLRPGPFRLAWPPDRALA